MIVLGFKDYSSQAGKLAEALDLPLALVQRHRFPDGEYKLTLPAGLPAELPASIIFCYSLDQPNEKLVELLLAASSVRQQGATRLTLVAPYLCYMRQDKAFHPGEVVSQPIIGQFLAGLFDNIITVDPHLHRVHHLHEAVPARQAVTLSATALMAKFLAGRFNNPLILGPDRESEQWVSAVAMPNQWQYAVCDKIRSGDRQVRITLPDIDLENREIVLVDDVASSGQTLIVATRECLARQAGSVDILVTHALFVNDALQELLQAGAGNVWSTDSVNHESNIIPLAPLLAEAVTELHDCRRP